jgi:hypothetical protein
MDTNAKGLLVALSVTLPYTVMFCAFNEATNPNRIKK